MSVQDRKAGGARGCGSALQVVVYAIPAAFVLLLVWIGYGFMRQAPEARARVAAAQREAPVLMQSLPGRPEAAPVGKRKDELETFSRGHQTVRAIQTFDAAGTCSDTADYYVARLTDEEWRVAERSGAHHAHLTKGRWHLQIGQMSESVEPSCRYTLTLTWSD